MNQQLLVGLNRNEIDAVLAVLKKTWVEPEFQPLILSAVEKLKRAQEMKQVDRK